ncbi:MAG: FG-GAP-like repeat-containing protein, partial [Anaerolineae bacterium]
APDEVTWSKQGPVLLPEPGGWDEAALWGPSVLKLDGTYWMWYAAAGPLGQAIGVVTSTDGIAWTRFLTGPVVSEPAALGDPVVIDDGGTLKMWYNNYDAGTIEYAESTDGIHWDLYPGNPVLEPGELANWGSPVVRLAGPSSGSVLDGLTITGGSSQLGGGVRADDQDLTVRNCLVRDNWAFGGPAGQGAGGVVDPGGQLTVVDSRIVNNQAEQGAGGIRVHHGTLILSNTLVAGNRGAMGVHLNGAGWIVNATIAHNDGGVLLNTDAGGTLAITNSVIYYNQWPISIEGNGAGQVTYSDVEGGWPGVGNLASNPAFVDASGGDYHLYPWSPCIDAGTAVGAPDHDLDGVPRPQNAGYDAGAFEFAGTPVLAAFTEVAAEMGLGLSSGEHGAAWGDLDGDGWLDLAIGDGVLFTNALGVGFQDATGAAGLDPIPQHGGVAWGDYDHDGQLDLLSSWRKVYRQNSLPFTKVWDQEAHGTALAWVDYDLDGGLDLFVGNSLYHNDGGDTFTDVTGQAGLGPEGFSSVWADYDGDGDPDLFMTCNGCPNWLFRYRGDGTFEDVSAAAGVDDPG